MTIGLPELFVLAIVVVVGLFLLTAVIAGGVYLGSRLSQRRDGSSQTS